LETLCGEIIHCSGTCNELFYAGNVAQVEEERRGKKILEKGKEKKRLKHD